MLARLRRRSAQQRACSSVRHRPPFPFRPRHAESSRPDVSLRWIYVHVIEEYARHSSHADLLREPAGIRSAREPAGGWGRRPAGRR
ncbi:DUF664 domain-containing protein [Streptomyces violascens]|uniref:mycothiol transferase n=1 Tax=Streptomyces violascens TaxID=67381 RepID=UPI003798684E